MPIAYIEAAIFGNEGHFGYDVFSAEIAKAFTEVLGIPSDRVYIKYEDITAWGVSGQYISNQPLLCASNGMEEFFVLSLHKLTPTS